MGLSGSLNATQFTYIDPSANPGSAVFRNGFQYTLLNRGQDIRRQPGIVVRDTLNNAPNTASFTIDGDAPQPVIGEKVEIRDSFDNDRLLFAGTIQTITQIYEGQIDQLAWQVQAVDFTWLANRRRPYGTYTNVSVSTIVKDLITRFCPGFTSVHVQTNLAKVTATFDGQKDLVTCLNELAAAIGGGHWYFDYDMDLHFFHVVPPGLEVPPSAMPQPSTWMTVAEAGVIPAGQIFEAGYYIFRHTFLYSDGTESSFQMISNVLRCTGSNILSFTGVPLGFTIGTATCVGRRIYYNKFIGGYPGGDKLEKINGFLQINDNTTTAFTTWFGATGASVGSIVALGSVKTYSTSLVATPGVPTPWLLLSDQAARLNLTGAISNGVYGNPNGVVVSPPSGTGTVSTGGPGIPAGWTAGATIYYKYTATNANGETTPGPTATVTLTSAGLRFFAPLSFPTGASNLVLYISDNNVEFHDIGAGLFGGQVVNFITPRPLWTTFPSPPSTNTAVIGIARGWIGYNGVNAIPDVTTAQATPPVLGGNIVYFASADVATELENAVNNAQAKPPTKSFNGHAPGPSVPITGTVDLISGDGFWNGGRYQFKYAYLYRDGSVSFPSPPSANIEAPQMKGSGVKGFNLQNITIGPSVAGLDVVARFVYIDAGQLSNPNFSLSGDQPNGFIWPIPFLDPKWAPGGGIAIIPDNTTTVLLQAGLAELGVTPQTTAGALYPGVWVGRGNVPYANGNEQALSVDPIPIWPNPDGPNLEDSEPPNDIDDDNDELLHADSGSQAFVVETDLSQIRNRVIVIGSGSVTVATGNVGDTEIKIADISAFSPHGGTVKYDDPGTGDTVRLAYTGVTGVVGDTRITMTNALSKVVPQGVSIANFFQAEDIESQKFLSKVELDRNGAVTDGVHEYVIIDTSLKAVFQLFMRAYAELELFSKPLVTIRYATRDSKTRSGQTVHVDLSTPPCLGDFLIQEVQIDQIHDESDDLMPRYTVTASSSRFELNDLLLKIIGGNIGNSGSSGAGVVPTSTTQSIETSSTNLLLSPGAVRRWGQNSVKITGMVSYGIVGSFNSSGGGPGFTKDRYPGVGGISTNVNRFQPNGANANLCGITVDVGTVDGFAYWEYRPKLVAVFRTGPILNDYNGISTHRMFAIGMHQSNSTMNGGVIAMTFPHILVVAYDPGSGGGSWEVSTANGNSQTRSNLGFASILPNTVYVITVEYVTINSAKCTVKDVTRQTEVSITVPVSGLLSTQMNSAFGIGMAGIVYGSGTISQASNSYIDIMSTLVECD